MGDYIKREDALNYPLNKESGVLDNNSPVLAGITLVLEYVRDPLYVPSADVAPVVHGKWLKTSSDYVFGACSICGCEPLRPPFRAIPYGYCPNCGAKMGEEETQ